MIKSLSTKSHNANFCRFFFVSWGFVYSESNMKTFQFQKQEHSAAFNLRIEFLKPVKIHQTGQEAGGGALPVSSVSFLTQVDQSVQMSQRILKLKQQEEGAHQSGSPNPTSHHEVRFLFFCYGRDKISRCRGLCTGEVNCEHVQSIASLSEQTLCYQHMTLVTQTLRITITNNDDTNLLLPVVSGSHSFHQGFSSKAAMHLPPCQTAVYSCSQYIYL